MPLFTGGSDWSKNKLMTQVEPIRTLHQILYLFKLDDNDPFLFDDKFQEFCLALPTDKFPSHGKITERKTLAWEQEYK